MNTNKLRRALALAMAMVLCLSLLPMSVMAADVATFEKVTSAPADWSGTYLLVYEGDTPQIFNSSLPSSTIDKSGNNVDGVIVGNTITDDSAYTITIEAVDGGYTMKSSSGLYLYSNKNENKLRYTTDQATAAGYPINFEVIDEGIQITGSTGTVLRYNKNTSNGDWFRFFKSGTYTNQQPVTLYKLSDGTSGPVDVTFDSLTPAVSGECVPGGELTLSIDTSSLTDQSSIGAISYQYKIDDEAEWTDVPGNILTLPATGEMGKHEVTIQAIMGGVASKTKTVSYVITQIVSIADARAMELNVEGITVQGTVIYIDGKNVVVQDETAGINVYCSNAATDLVVGDIIEATGKRAAYNGLEQLTNATYTKIGTASELPIKEVTLYDVVNAQTDALESTRILIKGVVIGAADGSNTPIAIGDSSINIYKMPEHTIPVGSVVDVVAVVSDFKGYQLRVASADDVSICAMDISDYRTGETFTAPEAEGFVFGGWYTDAALTTPLAKDVTTGTAYAKFVDETVLSIKWQITSGAAIDDATTNLRLMTSVDSLLYSSVGFNVNLENYNWNFTSKTVYSTILADDVPNDAATVFCASSAYFMTITIENVTNEYFGSEFTVVPTWVTLDGTTVTGVARTFTINDAFATAE